MINITEMHVVVRDSRSKKNKDVSICVICIVDVCLTQGPGYELRSTHFGGYYVQVFPDPVPGEQHAQMDSGYRIYQALGYAIGYSLFKPQFPSCFVFF